MKHIWIISEGSPGHICQSTGLVDALSTIVPLESVIIDGRATVRGIVRPALRFVMGKSGRPLPHCILKRISNIDIPKSLFKPDLIVSSGGKSVFVARTLAQQYKVPYIFIGERKPYPAQWFHTIISPVPGESCHNSIDVELIPTPVTPDFIAQKGITENNLWGMVIGGASRSKPFSKADWICLGQAMNSLARQYNIRWLLTTSRRTGQETESILKKIILPDYLEDAIWWAEAPRRELYSLMSRSRLLFVTQDSLTMVTEAVSGGKPVVTVRPERLNIGPRDFSMPYLKRLEANQRLIDLSCQELDTLKIDFDRFKPIQEPEVIKIAERLAKRLFLIQ